MKSSARRIPATPSLSPLILLSLGNSDWKKYFPFSEKSGIWAYKGRVALYHGIKSLELPANAVILVPSYHEGIEIDALLAAGFQLRYYRIRENLQIDFADVEHQLDNSVAALYVIHYMGFPQPLNKIQAFCKQHNLRLIEDCALSLFSRDGEKWLGSMGDMAIFSVHKSLPIPNGGFLITKTRTSDITLQPAPIKATLIHTLELFRQYLRTSRLAMIEKWITSAKRLLARKTSLKINDPFEPELVWDSRMIEYNASAWTLFLMRFINPEMVVQKRRNNYFCLSSRLKGRLNIPFPDLPEGTCPLFFPVMVENRLQFKNRLGDLGIESYRVWSKSHSTCPAYLAEEISVWRDRCLALPIHQGLNQNQLDCIVDAVLNIL